MRVMTMAPNSRIKIANFITLKAKPGQEENLANFLSGGADAVASSEPQTMSWYSVRINESTFGTIDFFTDQSGQDAHVSGQVATSLKVNADQMIVGGWEDGFLKNF